VELDYFFELALAARTEPRQRFGDEQPIDDKDTQINLYYLKNIEIYFI